MRYEATSPTNDDAAWSMFNRIHRSFLVANSTRLLNSLCINAISHHTRTDAARALVACLARRF